MPKRTVLLLCLLAFAPLLPSTAGATATLNFGIHAVPRPGPVAIDGKLDDWDLSGRVLICSDVESKRDLYSGEVAFMYDADNLYCSVHFKTPKPMVNVHNPKTDTFGWAGDCLQLRIVTDKITNVTAWYYAANREPHITLDYGKNMSENYGGGTLNLSQVDGWELQEDAEMAFLRDADGRGYVQELKLPFRLIVGKRSYAPGEQMTCGVELLWGDGAGGFPLTRVADNVPVGAIPGEAYYRDPRQWGPLYLEKTGHLQLPPAAWELKLAGQKRVVGAKIRYQLPTTGLLPQTYRVTIALTDPEHPDWIVSQPICGVVRTVTAENQGQFEEEWTGLDDNFMPLPAGQYGVKGIYMPARKWAISGEYHTLIPRLAAAPGDSWFPTRTEEDKLPWSWAAGDGTMAAVAVGEHGKAGFLSRYMEGDACWMVDLNQPVNWHQVIKNYYAQGPSYSVATDGEAIWADCFWPSENGKMVFRVDGAPFGNTPGINKFSKTYRPDGLVTALAAWRDPVSHKRFVYLAETGEAQDVRVLDGDTAEELGRIAVRNPQGLAVLGGKRLVVVHQDARRGVVVSEMVLANGVPTGRLRQRFVVPNLRFPSALALDSQELFDIQADNHGFYYVSDLCGNQVYRLDATGRVVHRYGRAPAQRPGHYDREVFMSPGKLALWTAADGQERLLVVERSFGRVSEWSVEGRLLREWVLGVNGDSGYCADPERPSDLYVPLYGTYTGRGLARFKVDYARGSWQVDAVWPDVCFGAENAPSGGDFPGGVAKPQILKYQGHRYLAFARATQNRYGYMLYRQQGDDWVPSAGLIPVGTGKPQDPYHDRYFQKWYWWHDANGDGRLQESEYLDTPTAPPTTPCYWGDTWLDDLSLTWMNGHSPRGYDIWRAAPTGLDQFGNPIFDGKWNVLLEDSILKSRGEGRATALYGGNELDKFFPGDWECLAGSMQDGFYVNARGGPAFGANAGSQYKLSRYVPDGAGGFRMKWRVGRAMYAHGSLLEPGDIGGAIFVSGPVNGLFGVQDSLIGGYHVYTTDGLWVDTLFIDQNRYPDVGGVFRLGGENFSGHHFLNRDNGKVYIAMAANAPATLFEVEGWTATSNPTRHLPLHSPTVTLVPEQIAPPAEQAASLRGLTPSRRAVFVRARAGGPELDGSLTGWEQAEPLTFQSDSEQQVEVRPLYDADHLYLRFQVKLPRAASPVAAAGVRDAFTHNSTADTLSLYLQGDPAATGAAADGRPGDVRVVFSLVKDGAGVRPMALGLYPKWYGPGPASPLAYSSAVGTVRFEHVGVLEGVGLGYVPAPDQGGFVLAVALPRSVIPLLPALGPGVKTRVDFEATLGGHNKFWWANSDGSANRETYDVPTEARLYPGAWAPGEFR